MSDGPAGAGVIPAPFDVYRDRGILIELDGMGEVDEVTQRIFDALDVIPQS